MKTPNSTHSFPHPVLTAATRIEAHAQPSTVIHSIEIQPVPNQRLFAVGAAAKYLGVSDDTLRKYADLGQIPVYRFLNGHRAFKLEDLNRLIDELPLWNDRASDTARAGRVREVS
jgi:excisionase family DNA binding protein